MNVMNDGFHYAVFNMPGQAGFKFVVLLKLLLSEPNTLSTPQATCSVTES